MYLTNLNINLVLHVGMIEASLIQIHVCLLGLEEIWFLKYEYTGQNSTQFSSSSHSFHSLHSGRGLVELSTLLLEAYKALRMIPRHLTRWQIVSCSQTCGFRLWNWPVAESTFPCNTSHQYSIESLFRIETWPMVLQYDSWTKWYYSMYDIVVRTLVGTNPTYNYYIAFSVSNQIEKGYLRQLLVIHVFLSALENKLLWL